MIDSKIFLPFCPGGLGRNLASGNNFIGSMKNYKRTETWNQICTFKWGSCYLPAAKIGNGVGDDF